MTRETALMLVETKWWEQATDEEIVKFQLYEARLCMPFDRFHAAIEKVLGRSVWTHEFAFHDSMIAEYEGRKAAPSMREIIELIPEDKRIILLTDTDKEPTS